MKKLIIVLIALLSLSFAVDYVGVNSGSKRGKFSKTSTPTFASVTTTTWNYTVTGNITGNSIVSVTSIDCVTLNASKRVDATVDIVAPTAYLTTVLSTLVNTTGVLSEKPLRFGSLTPTATVALTACTANYSMPCTINNVVYKILLRK